MNFIRAELIHKAFLMQPIKAFSFVHYNTNIKVSKNNDCLVVELVGRRGQKGCWKYFMIYMICYFDVRSISHKAKFNLQ